MVEEVRRGEGNGETRECGRWEKAGGRMSGGGANGDKMAYEKVQQSTGMRMRMALFCAERE